jgi:hypothetical protein
MIDEKYLFIVGFQVLDFQEKNEKPTFTKIVKVLDGRVAKNKISQVLDYMYDVGLVTMDYGMVDEKRAGRIIKLTEDGICLIKNIQKEMT